MKLLCVGDLHLGAGTDYGREPGERLAEQAEVWEQIRKLAAREHVDAILFAGDAFERRRPTPDELIAFHRQVGYLDIVAIAGNHDVANAELATGIEIFESGMFSVYREPAVHDLHGASLAVLPWTPPARLVARLNGGDRDEIHARVGELLVDTARDLYTQMPDGEPKILMLHWSVSGSSLPSGLPVDGLREPVIPLDGLEELGFDAIVAGHIHKPQMFGTDAPVFYTGSPMPLNFGEASVEHGVWILDVGVGSSSAEFVPVESRPFVTIDADLDPAFDEVTVNDFLFAETTRPEIPSAIVKVRYRATQEQARRIDHARIREWLDEAGAHKVYAIEPSIEREQRARVAGVDESIDEHQALDMWIEANLAELPNHREITARHARFVEEIAA